MKRVTLGTTDIEVSEICLGSMTWGNQNTEAEGHAQIDMALDRGIDFIDTAEMYPVAPVRAETVGHTEAIIGSWLKKTGRRDDVVIATKISGKNGGFVREGRGIFPDSLREAVENSLRRLGTDYIDVYQFHWPNRGSYHFRQNWRFDPSRQDKAAEVENMAALAEVLRELHAAGKIRAFGLSNDSAWGIMTWKQILAEAGAPTVTTLQNEYSLLCRLYDTDLAELAIHEGITLLAYSPLAAGLLSGKYNGGEIPPGSRMSLTADLGGRKTDRVFPAIEAYRAIAARHGLDPVAMSIAWTLTRPAPTIPIIGATSLAQLEQVLGADGLTLSAEVLEEIEVAHRAHPMPF